MGGGSRDVTNFVRATKDARDVLGAHHDPVVARQRLRELARVSGRGRRRTCRAEVDGA